MLALLAVTLTCQVFANAVTVPGVADEAGPFIPRTKVLKLIGLGAVTNILSAGMVPLIID